MLREPWPQQSKNTLSLGRRCRPVKSSVRTTLVSCYISYPYFSSWWCLLINAWHLVDKWQIVAESTPLSLHIKCLTINYCFLHWTVSSLRVETGSYLYIPWVPEELRVFKFLSQYLLNWNEWCINWQRYFSVVCYISLI